MWVAAFMSDSPLRSMQCIELCRAISNDDSNAGQSRGLNGAPRQGCDLCCARQVRTSEVQSTGSVIQGITHWWALISLYCDTIHETYCSQYGSLTRTFLSSFIHKILHLYFPSISFPNKSCDLQICSDSNLRVHVAPNDHFFSLLLFRTSALEVLTSCRGMHPTHLFWPRCIQSRSSGETNWRSSRPPWCLTKKL